MTTEPSPLDYSILYSRWENTLVFPFYTRSSNINRVGAMGTNRVGVPIGLNGSGQSVINTIGFHTVFSQRHSSKWAARAVVYQSSEDLEKALKTIEFAFRNQEPGGKFPVIATEITTSNNLEELGAMSFFLSDLQHTMFLIQNSRITKLLGQISRAAIYLYNNHAPLLQNDTVTPNRILQLGMAFYGLGIHLQSTKIKEKGEEILQLGLKFQAKTYSDAVRPVTGLVTKPGYTDQPRMSFARTLEYLARPTFGYGYFQELGGSDSSYNLSNLLVLLKMYSIVDSRAFRIQIWDAIRRGFRWQMRLLLGDNTFALTDNTRVGVESFNGKPKKVNYLEAAFVMSMIAAYTNNERLKEQAYQTLREYSRRTLTPRAQFQLYSWAIPELQAGNLELNNMRVALVQIAGAHNTPYSVSLTNHTNISDVPTAAIAQSDSFTLNQDLTGEVVILELVQPLPALMETGALIIYKESGELIGYCSNVEGLPYGPQGIDIAIDLTSVLFSY